jgi:hypothetical protein
MLGHNFGHDSASGSGIDEVKKLLYEFGIGNTVGEHFRGETVSLSDGGISFSLQVAVCADPSLVSKKVSYYTE